MTQSTNKSGEPFTTPVPLTRPPLLIAISLAVILLTVGVYAVLAAQVPTQVTTNGILLSGGYTIPVVSATAGQVEVVTASVGDNVQTSQSLGLIITSETNAAPVSVTSPFSGTVVQAMVRPGQVVTEGQALFALVNPDLPLQVTGLIPATEAAKVYPGQPVRIVPAAGSANSPAYISGTVQSLQPLPVSHEPTTHLLAQTMNGNSSDGADIDTPLQMREVSISITGDPTSLDDLPWVGSDTSQEPLQQGAVVTIEIMTGETSVFSVLGSQ